MAHRNSRQRQGLSKTRWHALKPVRPTAILVEGSVDHDRLRKGCTTKAQPPFALTYLAGCAGLCALQRTAQQQSLADALLGSPSQGHGLGENCNDPVRSTGDLWESCKRGASFRTFRSFEDGCGVGTPQTSAVMVWQDGLGPRARG